MLELVWRFCYYPCFLVFWYIFLCSLGPVVSWLLYCWHISVACSEAVWGCHQWVMTPPAFHNYVIHHFLALPSSARAHQSPHPAPCQLETRPAQALACHNIINKHNQSVSQSSDPWPKQRNSSILPIVDISSLYPLPLNLAGEFFLVLESWKTASWAGNALQCVTTNWNVRLVRIAQGQERWQSRVRPVTDCLQ